MKKAVRILALAAVAALVFTGCSKSGKQKGPSRDTKLENVVWRLVELDGKDIDQADKYELTFTAGGRIAGIAECNRFFGGYEFTNTPGGIKMGPVGSTMMACMEPGSESEFLQMFENIHLYQFSEDKLYLFTGNDMKARAIFKKTDKTPVTGEE